MFEELMMWFYGSMALMVGALLFIHWTKPKPPPIFPPDTVRYIKPRFPLWRRLLWRLLK